jgi:hypothetical protein
MAQGTVRKLQATAARSATAYGPRSVMYEPPTFDLPKHPNAGASRGSSGQPTSAGGSSCSRSGAAAGRRPSQKKRAVTPHVSRKTARKETETDSSHPARLEKQRLGPARTVGQSSEAE